MKNLNPLNQCLNLPILSNLSNLHQKHQEHKKLNFTLHHVKKIVIVKDGDQMLDVHMYGQMDMKTLKISIVFMQKTVLFLFQV